MATARPLKFSRSSLATILDVGVRWTGVMLLAGVLAASGQSQRSRRKTAPKKAAPVPVAEAIVPFHSGEQLSFRVLWSKFNVNAALAKLFVVEHRDFFNHPAWHFRLQAQTIDTTRMLYPLNDEFDSYTDAAQLTSLQYEMYLHEQGKQEKNVWRMSAAGDPAPADATAARVAPGTCDPVGLLYSLRSADWKTTPEFRAPVFDGVHLYEVVARLGESAGQVTVPAGTFKASRIDIRVFEHGKEMSEIRVALWLAQDAAHTPVLLEATAPVPIGSARVELTSAQQ